MKIISGCRFTRRQSRKSTGDEEMSKHTPGPWVRCKESPRIIMQGYEFSPEHEGPILASVIGNDNSGFFVVEEEAEANARLISAAPDLLEALERLVADFESEIHSEYDGTSFLDDRLSECDYARAAIAKARSN